MAIYFVPQMQDVILELLLIFRENSLIKLYRKPEHQRVIPFSHHQTLLFTSYQILYQGFIPFIYLSQLFKITTWFEKKVFTE